jgi:hypothetical protein
MSYLCFVAVFKMKINYKALLVIVLAFSSQLCAQVNSFETNSFKPNPEREKMFYPYLAVRHGGPSGTEEWKKSNTVQYYKELWYYCESFYIKKDHFAKGVSIDEAMIDISRFEANRKQDTEAIVELPGYKDALVLLPIEKLKYYPLKNNK